jgi:hypothetical protein
MHRFKILFAAILVAATAAVGGDFSGKWSGKLITDSGVTIPGYVVLQQKGHELTGTAGPTAEQQVAIQNGRIQGGAASLEAKPGPSTLRFVLRLQDEKLTGDVFEDGQRIGTATFQRVADGNHP